VSSFDQAAIERTYQNWAKVYDWLTPIYILGNEKRLRRETIGSLHLQPGQTVLDIACGTGRNFPLILERIGPSGKLVGVDYTSAMLDRARERVKREGWENVELIRADAARIDLERKFDAALCTLAIGVIPDHRGALDRMVAHVKSGGWLAIGDAKRSSGWYGFAFNWLADLLGYGAAEVMSRRSWESLQQMLSDFQYEEWFSGFFYVAAGRPQNTEA
jgi:demethylmenaquinone methyltransferase/2-methoxy-6-polyprenyl-1,4-benzoquinol methylase